MLRAWYRARLANNRRPRLASRKDHAEGWRSFSKTIPPPRQGPARPTTIWNQNTAGRSREVRGDALADQRAVLFDLQHHITDAQHRGQHLLTDEEMERHPALGKSAGSSTRSSGPGRRRRAADRRQA